MKFKVGDICKSINAGECGTYSDSYGQYIQITSIFGGDYHYDILDGDKNYIENCYNCFSDENLELVEGNGKAGRPAKAKPVKYVVGWEESRDPYQKFTDEKEMKAKVKELLANDEVEKDSIEVFEVKSHWTVKSNTSFRLIKA